MAAVKNPPRAFLPLDSSELTWEWDIPTDSLFLSRGAALALGLTSVPTNMASFYQLVPPEVAVELASARELLISGKRGSVAEHSYVCNGHWATEKIAALHREDGGRATRLLGFMEVTSLRDHVGFHSRGESLSQVGGWLFSPVSGQAWCDEVCRDMLAIDDDAMQTVGPEPRFLPVHPAEIGALMRHYELLCASPLLGENITDVVRMRTASGCYAPMLVRGSAVCRDEEGRALWVVGLITPEDTLAVGGKAGQSKDDRLFNAINGLKGGQWNWDTRQDAVYFSPRYLAILGYPPDDETWFAEHWRDYVHPDDLDKVTMAQLRVIISPEHGDAYECTYRMRRADGGWAWIFDRGCVTWREADGRAGHMIGAITNITTAQAERDQLEDLVRHDTLTGLRSRAFCNLEIEHIEQNDIRPVTVISVDITGLKMINDYLGHVKGDELLTSAATIMRTALRRSDCVGRIGGDEFIVLLPGCDAEKGKKVLEKLRRAFAAHNASQPELPVYAALGIASSDKVEDSVEEIIQLADERMYEDKKMHRREAHGALKELIRQSTGREVGVDDRLTDA